MFKPEVITELTLSTVWQRVSIPRVCKAACLQVRTAVDALFTHETDGRYWTLKSGSVLNFGLEGYSARNQLDTTDLVKNGAFTGNADLWTVPAAPWTYNANKVDKDADGVTPLSQIILGLIPGNLYAIVCTISNWTVESVKARLGGGNLSEAMGADGTFTQFLIAGAASALLEFVPTNASRFSIDTISMVRVIEPFLLAKAGATPVLEIIILN